MNTTILELPVRGLRYGAVSEETVSEHIRIYWQHVALEDDQQPEEHGKMISALDDMGCNINIALLCYPDDAEEEAILCNITYAPGFFSQFAGDVIFDDSFFSSPAGKKTIQFSSSPTLRGIVEKLRTSEYPSRLLRSLGQLQLCVHLLNAAAENAVIPIKEEEVPACRFLAYDSEREKILEACSYIEKLEGKPYTIRELSRKVAMNECYLKKGFKALTGKTIHEYQQDIRIARAKEMLQGNGMSVTDVALTLGYSSISHFSTAFKRVTGLKPCELLA